jgi:hypothetical protein
MPSGYQFPWLATEQFDAESAIHRLGPMFVARAWDDLGKVLASCEPHTRINLAGDRWDIGGTFVIDRSVVFSGQGRSTQIRKAYAGNETMVTVTTDNVVLENIWFRDESDVKDGTGLLITGASDVIVRNCFFEGFRVAMQIAGGSRIRVHDCHFESIGRSESGVANFGIGVGSSASGVVLANNVITVESVGDTAANRAISMASTVTDSAVVGNVCLTTTKIEFTNTGAAQTFAADGGSDNHVAGNSAVLVENT